MHAGILLACINTFIQYRTALHRCHAIPWNPIPSPYHTTQIHTHAWTLIHAHTLVLLYRPTSSTLYPLQTLATYRNVYMQWHALSALSVPVHACIVHVHVCMCIHVIHASTSPFVHNCASVFWMGASVRIYIPTYIRMCKCICPYMHPIHAAFHPVLHTCMNRCAQTLM